MRLLHAGAAAKAAAISSLPTPSIDAPSSFTFTLDDSDSDLSSVPPSSDSEDLSSADEAPKRKRVRRRKHGLPTPSATSGSSASPPRKRAKTSKDPTVASANDRKPYLTAGLYSTSLKQLANASERRRASAPPTVSTTADVFPLPINYGIYLLCPDKPRDFRLPFDIFDDYVADLGGDFEKERERLDKLGRGKKPDPYLRIRQNAYPFRKIDKSDIPPAVCFCKDGNCNDESCLNWCAPSPWPAPVNRV